ncbi:hypothetical protein GPL15_10385 [Clostridium sp. MCC353]|uniref:tripartite tricarboxylate transporter substrate-binding protein n=1 Tax=Clostridium sp. MCC353 TaxID=2592646 RepID=UPI001C023896|nr:tripartite tricarboxylate transporter substrate-binding protein [Clostridium sp. MCC353]MBT9776912.1 hypothetical protein [Clostridium sp. MCC353]
MGKKIKALICLGLITIMAALGLTGCASSQTTTFPKRPIEMVIPFGAGGASDIFARRYADIVKDYLGVPVTCVNKSAAGTVEGMAYTASQPSDGYLVLEITPSVLIKDVTGEFAFRDHFEPLIKVQNDLMAFGVAADSPFNTMEELIAYAKEHPGELKIGGLSPGGLDDYIANGFALEAGYQWTYVPYKSGSEVKAAVLGGELDVYQDKLSSFLPLVESGDIKTLVILNDKRVDTPLLQDVPCSEELGVDFTQGSWRGFCVAKGVPEDIKQTLIKAFNEAYQDPRYAALEEEMQTNLSVGYMEPEAYGQSWNEECSSLHDTFKQIGLLDENDKLVASDVKGDVMGEMGFPVFIIGLGIVLLIIIFLQSLKKAGSVKQVFAFGKPESGMLSTIIMLGLYVASMNYIGFAVSTFIFSFLNARLMGYKNYKVLAIFTVIFTVLVVLIFGKVFYVPLPRGLGFFRDLSYYVY